MNKKISCKDLHLYDPFLLIILNHPRLLPLLNHLIVIHLLLRIIIQIIFLLIIFHIVTPKYLRCLFLLISIFLFLLVILYLTPPSMFSQVWQSTKVYPPTPQPMKINSIPLATVNSISNQPDKVVKIHSSCRFPPE